MTNPLLVLFDIDGTLVDTGGAGKKALIRTFDEVFGIPDAFAGYSFSGTTDLHILRTAFLRRHGKEPTPEMIHRATVEYLSRLVQEMDKALKQGAAVVLPGVLKLLLALKEIGVPLGLATGNLEPGARLKLEPMELWHHFTFGGFGSDFEHRGELTRLGITRGVEMHGVPSDLSRIWVVGDSPLDVKAVRYAGARILAVATGIHPLNELEQLHPDAAVTDLSDTPALLALLTSQTSPIS